MIGEDFIFNGHYLSEYDMGMYAPDETQEYVTTNYDSGEITSLRAKPNFYGITYSDKMTLNFFICKDSRFFIDQEDMILTGDDVNRIRSWIESPKLPTELIVFGDEDSENTHYFGVFTSVQPFIVSHKCYGLKLAFTCNSPYGYSDVHTYTFSFASETSITKKIMNTSAEWNEYVKPIITIISSSQNGFGSNENLTVINQSDKNKRMDITLPSGKKKIIIDCEKKIVIDENGSLISLHELGVTLPSSDNYNFISTPSFLFYWLSLVPFVNTITISTSNSNHTISKVNIDAQYIIKSGGV